MRLILCDDDASFLSMLSARIRDGFSRDAEIRTCTDGNALMEEISAAPADAVFLDIDMPDADGFSLAEQIRKKTPGCMVVFCTCHNELVYESFEYEPLWFLCKDRLENSLGPVLAKIEERTRAAQKEYIVRAGSMLRRVSCEDILYVDVQKHKVRLHLKNETVEFRGRLSDAEENLPERDFVKINSGNIVNLKWVSSIRGSEIILENAETLAVSRSARGMVRDAFYSYLEEM